MEVAELFFDLFWGAVEGVFDWLGGNDEESSDQPTPVPQTLYEERPSEGPK